MGLIGAPLLLPANLGTMFGVNDEVRLWSAIALASIVFQKYLLGVWPVLKGFKCTPIATGNNPSQAMPADLSRTWRWPAGRRRWGPRAAASGIVVLPRPVHPGQPRVRGRPHRLRDRCNPRPPAAAGVRS
jgi:hypothetical protein